MGVHICVLQRFDYSSGNGGFLGNNLKEWEYDILRKCIEAMYVIVAEIALYDFIV